MQELQKAIEAVLGKMPEEILLPLVAAKLKAQGLALSPKEKRKLVADILAGRETITLRPWQFWKQDPPVVIAFTAEDADKAGKLAQKVVDRLPELIESTTSTVAQDILKTLKKRWPDELRRQHEQLGGFRSRLHARWGPAIDSLRMLLVISREYGESLNEEIRATPSENPRYSVEVLTRLHARACQVVEEIVSLLSAGLADGAMARWRTLHEIAVVALFISKKGDDVAERYMLHQDVESLLAAQRYQKCYEQLGYDAIEPEEMKVIQEKYDATVGRFGTGFESDFGWAGAAVGKTRPKFSDLEDSVGLDHWRAHYRLAANNVHANPKGTFFKLGLLTETDILLAGPSNAGLADPGQAAAISLVQICSALLPLQLTFDNLVALKTMSELEGDVGEAFIKAHQQLVEDEEKLRAV
jgi:hypothetical protein